MAETGQCCTPESLPTKREVIIRTQQDWEALLQEVTDPAAIGDPITSLKISPGQQPSTVPPGGSSSASSGPTRSLSFKDIEWPVYDELDAVLRSPLTKHLNTLVLTGCSRLTRLPSSVTDLQELQTLEVCSCSMLEELSAGMNNLLQLQKLTVGNCQQLKQLPADLCCAEQQHLGEVCIDNCTYLVGVPACLGSLSSLKVLSLRGNTRLNHVPPELKKCEQLGQLDNEGCKPLTDLIRRQSQRLRADLPAADRLSLAVDASNRYANIMKLATQQDTMVASLERMSWLAVMLATATFIGFLQPPAGTLITKEYEWGANPARGELASFTVSGIARRLPAEVRAFLVLDTWSFLLALSCLVIIVVLSMPRIKSDTDAREAGRFWILLVLAWGQLYLAVAAGCGAFVASALCVYDNPTAILVPTIIGSSILALGACFIVQRFVMLSPGTEAICLGLKDTWQRDLPFYRIPGMNALVTNVFACITCLPCTRPPPTQQDWDAGYAGPGCLQSCFLSWQACCIHCGLLPGNYFNKFKRTNQGVSGVDCC